MRGARVLAVMAAALAAAGCGGGSSATKGVTTASTARCVVKVYFAPGTPRPRELAVESRLRANDQVRSVTFVSKRAALRIMRKRYPQLARKLPYNPLPDALYVTPDDPSRTTALVGQIERAHYAGVANVGRLTPACRG